MARVIVDERTVVVKPWWVRARVVFTGAGLGLLWWIFTVIIKNYIVEPIACRDLSTAATCVDALGVSGAIAAVLVAIIGVFLLIRTLQPRPIVIAAGAAILLWSLGYYVTGLTWYEALLWGVLLYALSYALFDLIARIVWLPASLVTAAVVILVVRILLAL